jgi:hypothetical protein
MSAVAMLPPPMKQIVKTFLFASGKRLVWCSGAFLK